MAIFNLMLPARPGGEDTARSFAKDLTGSRLEELTEHQRRGDVRRETWTLPGPVLDIAGIDLAVRSGGPHTEVI